MADDEITIPARFNGPPQSANGGFMAGTVAALLGEGPATVSLRSPPPLDTPLAVKRLDDGSVEIRHGEDLVATGAHSSLDIEVPEPVDPETAEEAGRRGWKHWQNFHPFPTCFVCGTKRDHGDGLRTIAGPVEGSNLWAATWTPTSDTTREGEKSVAPEVVWAALDCPTSAPVSNAPGGLPIMLAELSGRVEGPVVLGQQHVVIAWEIAREGRKRWAGSAIFGAYGILLAAARGLWIERKPAVG